MLRAISRRRPGLLQPLPRVAATTAAVVLLPVLVASSVSCGPGRGRAVLLKPIPTTSTPYVNVAPYSVTIGGPASLAPPAGTREYLVYAQNYRVRQAGELRQIRIYAEDVGNISDLRIRFWRDAANTGETCTYATETPNIASSLLEGRNALIDVSGITLQVGDFYSVRITCAGSAAKLQTTTASLAKLCYTDSDPGTGSFAWQTSSYVGDATIPVELLMDAPQVVFIGDSLIAGHDVSFSMVDNAHVPYLSAGVTIPGITAGLLDWTYQNMGIGSQTTTQIAARFAADVVALKPTWVVINGGVNDLSGGGSEATYLANWTAILSACQTADIRVIALGMFPWTNGSDTQLGDRDTWRADLMLLCMQYGALYIDSDDLVGQQRRSGPTGNLWDLIPAYTDDGTHLWHGGYELISARIVKGIQMAEQVLVEPSFTTSEREDQISFLLAEY